MGELSCCLAWILWKFIVVHMYIIERIDCNHDFKHQSKVLTSLMGKTQCQYSYGYVRVLRAISTQHIPLFRMVLSVPDRYSSVLICQRLRGGEGVECPTIQRSDMPTVPAAANPTNLDHLLDPTKPGIPVLSVVGLKLVEPASEPAASAIIDVGVDANETAHPPPKGTRASRTPSPMRLKPALLNQTSPSLLPPIRKAGGGRLSRCQNKDCLTIACFGDQSDRIPRFCAKHKVLGERE
jgi:hypothetical protein